MTYSTFPQESETYESTFAFSSSNSNLLPGMDEYSVPRPAPRQQKRVDYTITSDLQRASMEDSMFDDTSKSFELVDEQEKLKVTDVDKFVENLGCDRNDHVKVVSIFGNTGDGKSHTLNHTFFGGRTVFSISPSQSS